MAMDRLKSEQDRLYEWLSSDPDYILKACGDILSMNQYREIENQSHALEKMRLLLKTIIQEGGDACQSFVDILQKHQAHYQQLQQFFKPNTQGAPTPIVFADSSSVFTAREITNTQGKSFSMKIGVSGPGSSQSGNVAGQLPQANYIATGGSVICLDKICNTTVDGDIDLSVNMTAPQVHTGRADETQPSSQEPAVKMIREYKIELINCLRGDCSFILQHVHTRDIVTDRQYQRLMDISQSEKTVIGLIDQLIANGQESCSRFLKVLKEPEVLKTYPQLNKLVLRNN